MKWIDFIDFRFYSFASDLVLLGICLTSLASGSLSTKGAVVPVRFGVATNFAVGKSPYTIAVADFNHDGKLDLVTANFDGNSISVLYGKGDGTFTNRADYAVAD